MKFVGQKFVNQVVTLDHNHFVDCEIRDCTVQYFGADFLLTRTTFSNVRFVLGGPAKNTLEFLKILRVQFPQAAEQLLAVHTTPLPKSVLAQIGN